MVGDIRLLFELLNKKKEWGVNQSLIFEHPPEEDLIHRALGMALIAAMDDRNYKAPTTRAYLAEETNGNGSEYLARIIKDAREIFNIGIDFKVVMDAVKENPLLMSEWERFMVSLKMSQDN